jgi:hypothetical protein
LLENQAVERMITQLKDDGYFRYHLLTKLESLEYLLTQFLKTKEKDK